MGLAEDLLRQARHLVVWEGGNPSQASLRRAVSTAYYSLFHLLTVDAGQRWTGALSASTGVERAFTHGSMRTASKEFGETTWTNWHNQVETVPPKLQRVACAFLTLQDDRLSADYNNGVEWSVADVEAVLETTSYALADWAEVRDDPMAGNYLLAMLLGKPR